MKKPEQKYDYIIAGGGMAGLSLAFYLNKSGLKNSKVLIVDRDTKTTNDHTWCFWEEGNSTFEEIVFHKWKNLWFHGTDDFSELLSIEPLWYKMIRAIDFYEFVNDQIRSNHSFEHLQADILSVGDGTVRTSRGDFNAERFVFDSTTVSSFENDQYHNLLQHFLGWTIKTPTPVFEPANATLFDFRTDQADDCRFVYSLPVSKTKALVEYTVFSDTVLKRTEYESALDLYLKQTLGLSEYKIVETEFGIVPMSDEPPIVRPFEKTIRIGTAGGFVKPSTGYSFARTQMRLTKLVEHLENEQIVMGIKSIQSTTWKRYLDSVLLDVLENKRYPADKVFTSLFQNNPPKRVLEFLDETTTKADDLKVMNSVPLLPFSASAISELLKKTSP